MNEIDALTLKLLTSKKRYNNYLASADPDRSAVVQDYYKKVQKNTGRIKEVLGKYLENPETETTNDIDDAVENCFKVLIKHFEMQDFEEKCAKNNYDATDSSDEDDKIFAGNEEQEEEGQQDEEEAVTKVENPLPASINSFWGKRVYKSRQ
jgi:hypothetical protein